MDPQGMGRPCRSVTCRPWPSRLKPLLRSLPSLLLASPVHWTRYHSLPSIWPAVSSAGLSVMPGPLGSVVPCRGRRGPCQCRYHPVVPCVFHWCETTGLALWHGDPHIHGPGSDLQQWPTGARPPDSFWQAPEMCHGTLPLQRETPPGPSHGWAPPRMSSRCWHTLSTTISLRTMRRSSVGPEFPPLWMSRPVVARDSGTWVIWRTFPGSSQILHKVSVWLETQLQHPDTHGRNLVWWWLRLVSGRTGPPLTLQRVW